MTDFNSESFHVSNAVCLAELCVALQPFGQVYDLKVACLGELPVSLQPFDQVHNLNTICLDHLALHLCVPLQPLGKVHQNGSCHVTKPLTVLIWEASM